MPPPKTELVEIEGKTPALLMLVGVFMERGQAVKP